MNRASAIATRQSLATAREAAASLGGRLPVIGDDRLDYSKGLIGGLQRNKKTSLPTAVAPWA